MADETQATDHYPYSLKLSGTERDHLDARIRDLATIAIDGKLGMLLGAGFSYSIEGLPLARPLATRLVEASLGCTRDVAKRIAEKFGLAAAAQVFGEDVPGRKNALCEFLQNELATDPGESPERSKLGSIIANCSVSRVFTTNYDYLIEKAVSTRGITVKPNATALAEFEQAELHDSAVGVFHIYGDLENPRITEVEMADAESIHLVEFRHELLRKLFVFIGYSFRDDDLVAIYREITALLERTEDSKRPFLVTKVTDEHEYVFAKRLWNRRHNIVLIPMEAATFLEYFERILKDVVFDRAAEQYAPNNKRAEFLIELKDAYAKLGLNDPREVMEIAKSLHGVE